MTRWGYSTLPHFCGTEAAKKLQDPTLAKSRQRLSRGNFATPRGGSEKGAQIRPFFPGACYPGRGLAECRPIHFARIRVFRSERCVNDLISAKCVSLVNSDFIAASPDEVSRCENC